MSGHPPVAQLVPHAGRALLLDRIVDVGDNRIVAELTITEDKPYCRDGRMGSWVGVELMAQCAAALAGLEAWRRGRPPRVGFLLGVRRYRCTQPAFLLGQRLRVEAEREFEAGNGVGAARCRILAEDQTVLSEAAIAVFQPEDPRSALGSA